MKKEEKNEEKKDKDIRKIVLGSRMRREEEDKIA